MSALYAAHVIATWTAALLSMFGSRRVQDAALVVLGNWMAAHILVWVGGEFAPWAGYLLIDGASAVLLAWWMTRADALLDTIGPAALATLYAFQCAAHVEFAMIDVDPQAYWLVLVWIALAQVGVLMGWLCLSLARRKNVQ